MKTPEGHNDAKSKLSSEILGPLLPPLFQTLPDAKAEHTDVRHRYLQIMKEKKMMMTTCAVVMVASVGSCKACCAASLTPSAPAVMFWYAIHLQQVLWVFRHELHRSVSTPMTSAVKFWIASAGW